MPALGSEAGVYGKIAWRIIPLLFVCYIAAYLDRVNVSFAKLQMQADVPAISDTVFGLGTGLRLLLGFAEAGFSRESSFTSPIGFHRVVAGKWSPSL